MKPPRPRTKNPLFSRNTVQSVLFFLFAFLLPTQLGKHYFLTFSFVNGVRIDYLAPALYLSDIAALLLILVNLTLFAPLLRKKNLIGFLLLIAIGNGLVAFSKPLFFFRLLKLGETVAVFFIFAKNYRTYKKVIIAGLALATFVQLPLVIAQLAFRHSLQGIWYFLGERAMSLSVPGIAKASLDGRELLRPYGTFSHPNSMAGFFLLIELFFLAERDITNLFLKYAVIFCASIMVMVSFSKNAILVYLFLNLLYVWKTKGCRLCIAASAITSLTVAALFLSARTDAQSFEKRFTLIGQSLTIITRYPFGGVGLGNYLIAQASFPVRYAYFFLQPVHNIILLAAAEIGLPLTILLAMLSVRFLHKRRQPVQLILLAAVLMTGMGDHYWLTLQQNMLLAATLLGAVMYNIHHGTQKTLDGNR